MAERALRLGAVVLGAPVALRLEHRRKLRVAAGADALLDAVVALRGGCDRRRSSALRGLLRVSDGGDNGKRNGDEKRLHECLGAWADIAARRKKDERANPVGSVGRLRRREGGST